MTIRATFLLGLGLGALVHVAACYGGISGFDPSAGDGTTGASGTEDSGTDDGAADVAVSPSRLARLTRAEHRRTVTAIFGAPVAAEVDFDKLPPDGKVGRFTSNAELDVNIDSLDAYRLVAEDVGEAASAHASELLGCEESPECVTAFITGYGRRIYRRPLEDAEVGVFVQFWDDHRQAGTTADAMRLVVTAFLQTPDFLYRLEKGTDGDDGAVRQLTGYELATRLSFFLWGEGPDDALLDAAGAGELDDAEGLGAHVDRMLADPRADETLVRFHFTWLGIEALETQLVDAERFPQFEALRDDMLEETRRFVLHVLREGDAQLETLLTADYSFASPELAAFYGDGVAGSDAEGRITLDGSQRRGLLTHASYLASHARTPERAPIYRGKSVLADVLCMPLAPPQDADTNVDFDSTSSARQQIEDATASPACAGCHRMINPLGFLFEHYDGVGQWRTEDGEWPVEAEATVMMGSDIDGTYADATALIEKLPSSSSLATCITRQWLRFALSRPEGTEDEGSIDAAGAAASGDMFELVGAIPQTEAFRYRRLPTE
jgi:hypothetical protein